MIRYFILICELLSLKEVHDKILDDYLSDVCKYILTAVVILLLILIIGKDYIWYIIAAPLVFLCISYSLGIIEDVVDDSDALYELDEFVEVMEGYSEDNMNVLSEIDAIEQESEDLLLVETIEDVPDTQMSQHASFVCGAVYSYLCITYPHITFVLGAEPGYDVNASINIAVSASDISVAIHARERQYQFSLIDNKISEYDGNILKAIIDNSDIQVYNVIVN